MIGLNQKVLTIANFSGASATTEYEMKTLTTVERIEVQVDWSGVTGATINGVINVFQREESTMQYALLDSTMTKNITATTGTYIIKIPQWTASDLKLRITKNNLNRGSLNAAIGYRR